MRVAILSPGPSLNLERIPPYDLAVGVNRVATRHPVDIWSALDWTSTGPHGEHGGLMAWIPEVRGNPRLLTTKGTLDVLNGRGMPWRGESIILDGILPQCPVRSWATYSAEAAMGYAGIIGASEVHCHGMDWGGTKDWDGHTCSVNREPDRWERERQLWREVTAWLNSRGCLVVRHTPDGPQFWHVSSSAPCAGSRPPAQAFCS